MVGAVSVVIGVIGGSELVMGDLCGGIMDPTMLRFIRHRGNASVEAALNVNVRDLRVILEDRREGKYRRIVRNKRFDVRLSV